MHIGGFMVTVHRFRVQSSTVHGLRLKSDEEYISPNEFKDVYEQAGG